MGGWGWEEHGGGREEGGGAELTCCHLFAGSLAGSAAAAAAAAACSRRESFWCLICRLAGFAHGLALSRVAVPVTSSPRVGSSVGELGRGEDEAAVQGRGIPPSRGTLRRRRWLKRSLNVFFLECFPLRLDVTPNSWFLAAFPPFLSSWLDFLSTLLFSLSVFVLSSTASPGLQPEQPDQEEQWAGVAHGEAHPDLSTRRGQCRRSSEVIADLNTVCDLSKGIFVLTLLC